MQRFRVLTPLLLCGLICALQIEAAASPELDALIRCHEALTDRSDGTSQKLSLEKPTPFVFQKASKYYFVTDSSIGIVDNASKQFNGTLSTVTLTEKNAELTREIEIRKNGELGSVCCSDGKGKKLPALEPRAQLGPETLKALREELANRLKTVEGSYQNKSEQMNIVGALHSCEGIDFGKPDPVARLLKKYQSKAGKSATAYKSEDGKR